MHGMHKKPCATARQPFPRLSGQASCLAAALFLISCSSLPTDRRGSSFTEAQVHPPLYSIIFAIHGDNNYLYHDTRGMAYRADEEVLSRAILVATRNPQAEVFIFHQRPRRHTLLFFPRHDGKLYYYRQGRLLAEESYWRGPNHIPFGPEADLYRQYHAGMQPPAENLFLYFGHEIPEYDGAGYDASYSDRTFTVHDLADGLKDITGNTTKLDLIVLSTCYNGTPYTVAALSPYARTIVASPPTFTSPT